MGNKGDQMKRDSVIAAELLVEKLQSIKGITIKKMFGGHGVFHDGKMFGMVDSQGNYLLKVNESNRSDYEKVGATKHSKMPYFSVPQTLFNNQDDFIKWAKKSIAASK